MLAKKTITTVALMTVVMFFGVTRLEALSLEPLSHTFSTSVAGRVRTFQVTNTQEQRISVRIRMTTRDQTVDGTEDRRPADDQWLIFPRQITLEPGASQAVRVQYTGSADVDVERAYRIIAEQLPIDFSEGQARSGINVLFRYEGSVYVRPEGAEPDVVLAEASRRFIDGDFRGILLRFENRGRSHAILNDLTITLQLLNADGEVLDAVVLEEDQLSVVGGTNLLAGRALEQLISLPQRWQRGAFDVSYDVDLVQ